MAESVPEQGGQYPEMLTLFGEELKIVTGFVADQARADSSGSIIGIDQIELEIKALEESDKIQSKSPANILIRAAIAVYLTGSNRFDQATLLISRSANPADIFEIIPRFIRVAKHAGISLDVIEVEKAVLRQLDNYSPQAAIDLLRFRRRQLFSSPPEQVIDEINLTDARLMDRLGKAYDPAKEWVESWIDEFPFCDWQMLEKIVEDDSLWSKGLHVVERQFIALGRGIIISRINSGKGIKLREDFKKGLIDEVQTKEQEGGPPISPGVSYLHAMLAVAIYSNGTDNRFARRFLKEAVFIPEAVSYAAQELLRLKEPMVEEARRIAENLTDAQALVSLLIDGKWPDKTWPNQLLNELITLRDISKRVGKKGPIPSLHPIQFRLECMNVVADRLDKSGDTDGAEQIRKRAKLLEKQELNGIVAYMPKKAEG